MHPLYSVGFAELAIKAFRGVASVAIVGLVILLIYGSVYAGTAGFIGVAP